MRVRAVIFAALAGAMMVPAVASAQVFESIVVRRGGGGMLGLATQAVRSAEQPARQRVITEVVAGSAAERAGLAVGDTIVRINGFAATEQVMFAPLEAGDTVVLRIRRGGQERDVTVIAGVRPEQSHQVYTVLPDSIQRQMSVIMRDVQERLDTISRRGIVLERMAGDSNVVFRFGSDSVRIFSIPRAEVMADSVRAIMREFSTEFPRVFGDSARFHIFTSPDSARISFGTPRGQWLQADTIRFLNPGEVMAGSFSIGMRSVAGAELSELNPGLAEYFGVVSGVLVLNAREGTPAASAGIRAGDVIVRANGTNITSVADLRRALAAARPGAPVDVRVLRHGQPVDLRIGG